MRTTITIDDELYASVRAVARERGVSISEVFQEAARVLLAGRPVEAEPFELITYGRGGPLHGIDLDRIGLLLAAEDELTYPG